MDWIANRFAGVVPEPGLTERQLKVAMPVESSSLPSRFVGRFGKRDERDSFLAQTYTSVHRSPVTRVRSLWKLRGINIIAFHSSSIFATSNTTTMALRKFLFP
jgi:hypothetical protein